jgi:hypothetical protein
MPHESAREVFERGEGAVGRLGDMRRRMRILVTDHHHTPPDRTERLAELSSQIDELRERISADESSVAEMERVIAQQLKPLLMREILFGSLRQGGTVVIGLLDNSTIGLLPPTEKA